MFYLNDIMFLENEFKEKDLFLDVIINWKKFDDIIWGKVEMSCFCVKMV